MEVVAIGQLLPVTKSRLHLAARDEAARCVGQPTDMREHDWLCFSRASPIANEQIAKTFSTIGRTEHLANPWV